MQIDKAAALRSCSVGKYQIMLFNYHICGFSSPEDMWEAFLADEKNQLKAFINFLIHNDLVSVMAGALQISVECGLSDRLEELFLTVEKKYNGGGQNGAYAEKMIKYFKTLHDGKWKDWDPESFEEIPPAVPEVLIPPKESEESEVTYALQESDTVGDPEVPVPPKKPKTSAPSKTEAGAGVVAVGGVAGLAAAGTVSPWIIGGVVAGIVIAGAVYLIMKGRK